VTEVAEIVGNNPDGSPILNKRYTWDPVNRNFKFIDPSSENDYLFEKISELNHISTKTLIEQFERKQVILKWMTKVGLKNQEEVAEVVRSYYLDPDELYQRAKLEV
jgi:hypothetical protein